MVSTKAFALAAIFATLTAAAPFQKRAVVYETVTEYDVTTIDTTITVYPGEATPTGVPSVYTTEVVQTELCGATITVNRNGKTAVGRVVDKCMGCDANSIDLSRSMFSQIADMDEGRVTVSWSI
ncbi:hypothetical protein TMatcc_003742 [Talaromyces marneffei ATCC 18224]